ncbi:acid protease [Russula decolorans]
MLASHLQLQASGYLAQAVNQMAGFQVQNQSLVQPVSGLMGLGWRALSSSGAKPFWQVLYESNVLDQPPMAFYLTRFQNVTGAKEQESRGVFTLDIPSGFISYWTLAIKNLTVSSNSVTVPSGQASYTAIDTGTTLIGGPAAQVASVYAQIPNSVAGTGNYEGYYLYGHILSGQCVESIFVYTGTSNGPGWIIGDTFLKNVYTVFRANPASVGFAALATGVQSSVTENGVLTPTIGSVSVPVSVTGSSGLGRVGQNAALPSRTPHLASLYFVAMSTLLFYLL